MTIRKLSEKPNKLILDLSGPDGNAFYLMGVAHHCATQLGWDRHKIKWLLKEMRTHDYAYLVELLESFFGDLLVIYVPDPPDHEESLEKAKRLNNANN